MYTKIKKIFVCSLLIVVFILHISPVMAAYEGSKEQLTVTSLYSATSLKSWFSDTVYSPVCSRNGAVYFVYIGEDFYPYIGKSTDGQTTVNRLCTNDNYKVYDDGHHEFSLGIDRLGYIHVTGDMHNFPEFEVSNVPADWLDAKQLYWISDLPDDISSFSFVGDDVNKQMPGTGFSYGFFRTDRNGELFYMTRALAKEHFYDFAGRGLALYYYSVDTKKWIARGALIPDSGATYPMLIWEDNGQNGGSYQRYNGNLLFDKNNRMHIAVSLNNSNSSSVSNYVLYAYSDDSGITFHKANAARINELPIRADSGPAQGDVVDGDDSADIGEVTLSLDRFNHPALNYPYNGHMYYRYWTGTNWSKRISSQFSEWIRGFFDEKHGITTMYGDYKLYRLSYYGNPVVTTLDIGARMRYLDYNSIRNGDGILYGACWNMVSGDFSVLKLDIKEITSWGITSLSENNGIVKVKIANNLYNLTSPLLIITAYNEEGKLLLVQCKKFESNTSYFDLRHIQNISKLKAMLWKDSDSLSPLTDSVECTVNR